MQPIAMDFALQQYVLSAEQPSTHHNRVVMKRAKRNMDYWLDVAQRHDVESQMHGTAIERASSHAMTVTKLGGQL